MKITRISRFTGIERTWDLDITEEQIRRVDRGEYIQVVMANLTPMEREFYMTGATAEEWLNAFPDEGEAEEPTITKHHNES